MYLMHLFHILHLIILILAVCVDLILAVCVDSFPLLTFVLVTCFPMYVGNFIVSACFGLLSVGIFRGLYIKYILCKSIFVFCHQAGRDTDDM